MRSKLKEIKEDLLRNDNTQFQNQHRKVIEELHELAVKKNHDYGDSFSKIYAEFGLQSSVIRLADKFYRLQKLTKVDAQVDESIRDTLMDMANYCVLTVMELDKRSGVVETR